MTVKHSKLRDMVVTLVTILMFVIMMIVSQLSQSMDFKYDNSYKSDLGNTAYMVIYDEYSEAYTQASKICSTHGGQYAQFSKENYIEVACNDAPNFSYFILK